MLPLVIAGLSFFVKRRNVTPRKVRRWRHRIGEEWDDPSTSPDRLAELLLEDPRVLTNPNLDPDLLLEYAHQYPFYVETNPVLPIFSLDQPLVYTEIMKEIQVGYLDNVWKELSPSNQRLLAVRFVAHVLLLYEGSKIWKSLPSHVKSPSVHSPRQSLRVAIRYALGQASVEDCKKQEKLAEKNAAAIFASTQRDTAAYFVAQAASCSLLLQTIVDEDLFSTSKLAMEARAATAGKDQTLANRLREEELTWQVDQIRLAYERERVEKKRSDFYAQIQQQIQENAKRQEQTQEEIKIALAEAHQAAEDIKIILQSEDVADWSTWIGLGLVGVGAAIIAITVGPELLLAAGIAEGANIVISAAEAAAEVIAVSQSTGVTTVSVDAFLQGAEVAFANDAEAAGEALDWIGELAEKLARAGLQVVEEEVVVVAKGAF